LVKLVVEGDAMNNGKACCPYGDEFLVALIALWKNILKEKKLV